MFDPNKMNEFVQLMADSIDEHQEEINKLLEQVQYLCESLNNKLSDNYIDELREMYGTLYDKAETPKMKAISQIIDVIGVLGASFGKINFDTDTLRNTHFTQVDADIDTNITHIDRKDFIDILRVHRPKTRSSNGKEVAKRGRFTIYYRYVLSNGKYTMPFKLCNNYDVSQNKINHIMTTLTISGHYAIQIVFGTMYLTPDYQDNWKTIYVNPNEIVQEMYELSKL